MTKALSKEDFTRKMLRDNPGVSRDDYIELLLEAPPSCYNATPFSQCKPQRWHMYYERKCEELNVPIMPVGRYRKPDSYNTDPAKYLASIPKKAMKGDAAKKA